MKKRVYRKWVKNMGLLIVGAILGITIYTLFTTETHGTTPNGGEYTCKGAIVRVCSGDSKASKYFE